MRKRMRATTVRLAAAGLVVLATAGVTGCGDDDSSGKGDGASAIQKMQQADFGDGAADGGGGLSETQMNAKADEIARFLSCEKPVGRPAEPRRGIIMGCEPSGGDVYVSLSVYPDQQEMRTSISMSASGDSTPDPDQALAVGDGWTVDFHDFSLGGRRPDAPTMQAYAQRVVGKFGGAVYANFTAADKALGGSSG